MKRINVSELIPGMVTAEDVYSFSNQLIVSKNTPLTDKIINRLTFYSVVNIRIDDSISVESTNAVQLPIEDERETWPYSRLIQSSPEFKEFKTNFDVTIDNFKHSVNDIVEKGTPIDISAMLEQTLNLFHTSNGAVSFFNMLHNMRQYDDLTYAHCINVSLICNVLANWLHFSKQDIELATLCGLFHDIGKMAIPDEIIKKPSKLTNEEYNIMKTHTIAGYNILKNQDISVHIKNSALMHHERCDGSGYPFGLKKDKIDKFAKLVSIADVYDAMTAARVYRGPLCPFGVIEIFEKEGLQRYDTKNILCFLENVVMTYINNRVRLSDGSEGDIVFLNRNQFSRPMIKCGDRFVDLSKEKSLSIIAIL